LDKVKLVGYSKTILVTGALLAISTAVKDEPAAFTSSKLGQPDKFKPPVYLLK
jgi:hypothetical protein